MTGLLDRQARWLKRYRPRLRIDEVGSVVSVGDGIARISGLPSAAMDDVLAFSDGSRAMVFDLTEDLIGAVLLHETEALTAGTRVQRTGRSLSVPAGDALLGRIIDPLGTPLDGRPPPVGTHWQGLEAASPPIVARDFVHDPLDTGIKVIDTLIPIGKGQRQLLIGDEGLGRSSIALDTIIHQRGKKCVLHLRPDRPKTLHGSQYDRYSACLSRTGVHDGGRGGSEQPAGPAAIGTVAGCAIAEFWMQQGRDVLVVYDDLSTHARTYRELSLLLRRPPGREAYPGDIFSVHARLLERATCLNAAHGGGSMTALPIVETQIGEIAAYIPTNLISITDGQIYLDRGLFAAGFRPAIDIARSVSRIGGKAQHPRIKEEAGRMKLDYLQFLELEVFTRFGAHLEASMEKAIQKGRVLREILKQDRLSPLPATFQMAWLVAFNDGLFEGVEPDAVPDRLAALEEAVRHSSLSLDSARKEWSAATADWLARPAEAASA
jgi:F-type H+/Na+-transporting ATPase subunit alpha